MILRGLARNTWGTVKTSQICGLYTPPHISNFPWTPFGVHGESTRTAFPLLPLFQESMWTLCGVHMDFVKFMDSMKTCDQVSCGLLWTPSEVHGLSVDCCELLQKSTPPSNCISDCATIDDAGGRCVPPSFYFILDSCTTTAPTRW